MECADTTAHPPAPAAAPSDAEVEALIRSHEWRAQWRNPDCVSATHRIGGTAFQALSERTADAFLTLLRDRQQHAAATAAAVQAGMAEAVKGLERIHDALLSNGPKQACGEMAFHFLERARSASKAEGTTTLAALLAEAREKAIEDALQLIGQEAMSPHNDSLQHLRIAVTALIPTPSPERGEAQQQGAGGKTDAE